MKKISPLIFLILLLTGTLSAQYKEAGHYVRKSVIYLNKIVRVNDDFSKISPSYFDEIENQLRQKLQMGRFDYMQIPRPVISRLTDRLEQEKSLTFDSLNNILEETLLPRITAILQETVDIRGKDLLTEAQRNSKISIKARELGLTVEQLQILMNSAYIYVPYVSRISRIKSDESITWSVSIGMVWYRVLAGRNEIVKFKKIRPALGVGYAKEDESYSGYSGPDDFAFSAAVSASIKNIKLKIKALPQFRLTAQILDKSGFSANIDMGNRDGIRHDDKFFVIEETEDQAGKVIRHRVGYGFITSIGNTKKSPEAVSKLKLVSGITTTEPGMTIEEHPRMGIDLSIRYKNYRVYDASRPGSVESFDSMMFHGAEAALLFNFGRYIGLNQTFLEVGAGLAGGKTNLYRGTSDKVIDMYDALLYQVNTGLVKKYYVSRLALHLAGGFAFRGLQLQESAIEQAIKYTQMTGGMYARAGFEFVLGVDFNLIGFASYNFMGTADNWTVKDDAVKEPDWRLKHSSLTFGGGFVWSLPSLPFDPWAIFRGLSGI